MTTLLKLPTGDTILLAQASTTTKKAATDTAKKKGAAPKEGTIPSWEVAPSFDGVPGAQNAFGAGMNLLGAIALGVLALAWVISIIRLAVGYFADFPDHVQGGKKMLMYTVPLTFAVSIGGQLIGWGWTLGAVPGA